MISSPKYPDPNVTAAAQAGMNRDTAITQMQLNSGTQINPWGTTSTEQTGSQGFYDSQGKWVETPTFTTTQTLTPEQKEIFNRTQAAEQNLAGIAEEQSGKLGDYLNDPFTFDNRDAETWAWDLASPRILGQQQENRNALRTQLINSGLRPGTAAFDAEMSRMDRADTDQLNQLALTGRTQAFSEALAQRNQPLNELIGLMSGTQVQNPAAMNAQAPSAGVAGVDYTGLVNEKFKAETAAHQAKMGGLFGLAAAPFGMFSFSSDRRLKRNIRRIGTTKNGLPWYEFNYLADPDDEPVREGLMSDDVRAKIPDAVAVDARGFDVVDYRMALEAV